MKQTQTTSASKGLYTNINTVAMSNWPIAISSIRPLNWTNWLIWSTSLVTRETRAPRRSPFWVSIDRS